MATRTPTYYSGTITGQAGTLITVLDAILVTGEGWTKTYSGTNKAVYTQATHNGFCLRVNDDGSLASAGAREATVRGGESATDVDTLIDPFPTATQHNDTSAVWRKSETADATARTWNAVADGGIVHLYIDFQGNARDIYSFGSPEKQYPGDGYCCYISTRAGSNSSAQGRALGGSRVFGLGATIDTTNGGFFFARSVDGVIKSDRAAIMSTAAAAFGNSGAPIGYPAAGTNKMHLDYARLGSQYYDVNGATAGGALPRCVVPFLFEPIFGATTSSLADLDTFEDTAYDATADSLKIYRMSYAFNDTTSARAVLQIAGTWDPGF